MARQGNYVSVPGGSANWSKGISESLTDLSKSLIGQGNAEEERARLAAAAEEGKRRWEADQSYRAGQAEYQRQRDSILDQRAKDAVDESKRRWDLQEERRAQAEKERLQGIKAEKDARVALWDLASPDNQTFELSDYSPELQQSFEDLTNRVSTEKGTTRDFLFGEGDDVQAATAAYRTNLEASKLPKPEIDRLVAQQELDLRGLKDELSFGDYTPEQIDEKINTLVTNRYDSRLKEIQDKIRTGEGLTQSEKVRALLADISPEIRENLDVKDAKSLLGDVVTGPTKDALLASEKARVEAANETMLKNIELYDDYIGRMNAGSSKGNYASNVKGMANALRDMGKVDIGWWDTADAKKGFNTLVSSGIDPELAAASIAFGIDKGWVGDSFPSVTSTEFAKIQQQAELLQKGKRTGSGGRTYVDRDVYRYTPEQSRSLSELQRDLVTFTPNNTGRLGVSPEFSLERTLSEPGINITPPASTTSTPDTTTTTEEPTADKSVLPPPVTVEDVTADLEKQGVTLDLGEGELVGPGPGRMRRVLSDDQITSRAIVDTIETLNQRRDILRRIIERPNTPNKLQLLSTENAAIAALNKKLQDLKKELVTPQ
jgi:hypothetical protein